MATEENFTKAPAGPMETVRGSYRRAMASQNSPITTQKTGDNYIGSFQGVPIRAGTDADVSAQIRAIKSSDLTPQREIKPPAPAPAVATADAEGYMQGIQEGFSRQDQMEAEAAKNQLDPMRQQLYEDMIGAQGETELTTRAYEREGVDEMQRERDDIRDQIRQEEYAMRRKQESIEDEAGLTAGQKRVQIAEMKRHSLRKQADLAISEMGIEQRYDTARAIADRAVALQLERQKMKIEASKFMYNEHKDLFNKYEERVYQARIKQEERDYADNKEELTNKYNLALQLQSENAPTSVVKAILDAGSFEEAIEVASSYTPTVGGGVPKIFNIDGQDMIWDSVNMEFVPAPVSGAIDGAPSYSQERATRTVQSVDELLVQANQSPSIFGRTAAFPLPGFLRTDEYRNFKAELDTLKSNIAFNELTAMREASKTGGALGQVSDREGQLLQSALGALSMSQSPENVVEQLNKIKASINRWQEAVNGTKISYTVVAPNGEEVIITD